MCSFADPLTRAMRMRRGKAKQNGLNFISGADGKPLGEKLCKLGQSYMDTLILLSFGINGEYLPLRG